MAIRMGILCLSIAGCPFIAIFFIQLSNSRQQQHKCVRSNGDWYLGSRTSNGTESSNSPVEQQSNIQNLKSIDLATQNSPQSSLTQIFKQVEDSVVQITAENLKSQFTNYN